MSETKGMFENINDKLGQIFRHVLPGMFILSLAYITKPSWFNGIKLEETNHLVFLAALAILIGNSWYVVNRYTCATVFDFLFYKFKLKKELKSYSVWLTQHINSLNALTNEKKKTKENLFFKVGQLLYMQIMGQALILFTFLAKTNDLFLNRYSIEAYIFGGTMLLFSYYQIYLVFMIDEKLK